MEKLENTRSHVRCIRSMCRSFWQLILKQTVILTAMSNYFLSLSADDRRQTETLLYRGPAIDASYQVSVHLAKRFQRRRFFQKSTNQKQELSVAVMSVNGSGRNEQSQQRIFHRCFLPSFDSFGQTVSEEKNLKNQPITNKNRLWWPCLSMDRDEINTLYRGPPIDASYKVSVHLAKRFQSGRIKKISQSETRFACGGHIC